MRPEMTLLDFQKRFQTQEDCVAHLEKLRWPKGFVCPNCGHDDGYPVNSRALIQCCVCRHQTSVTAGTIFHKTRIPLPVWFWMIYMMSQDKGGASVQRMATQLGLYYSTAWHIAQKIRHAMGRRDQTISLAGFIELDEAIIGPHARKTGRQKTSGDDNDKKPKPRGPRPKRLGRKPPPGKKQKTQTEVVVMVERERYHAGSLAMKTVESKTRDDIRDFVCARVEGAHHFKTDGLQSHAVLQSMGHSLDMKAMSGKEACEELPVVHRVISLLKRFLLGTYHGVSARYLQRYLNEFCFRFIRRDTQRSICSSLLRACVFTVPMTYAELKL